MVKYILVASLLLCFLMGVQSTQDLCQEKFKSLASLRIAMTSIFLAKDSYPKYVEDSWTPNDKRCGEKEKSFAYLDVAISLIEYAVKHCANPGGEEKITDDSINCDGEKEPFGCPDVPTALIEHAFQNYPGCQDENSNNTVNNSSDDVKMEEAEKENEEREQSTTTTTTQEPKITPTDCSEVQALGYHLSGVYSILLKGGEKQIQVFCDMDTAGGGWTVIQRRGDFTPQENFNRDWKTYKEGFGNVERDFWLGNDNIFELTNQGTYSVRFDLETLDGEKLYALYKPFRIDDEASNYTLHIRDYSGNADDTMFVNHHFPFSTADKRTHGENCPQSRNGGWWHTQCSLFLLENLNGLYSLDRVVRRHRLDHIFWRTHGKFNKLKRVEIKIKRV